MQTTYFRCHQHHRLWSSSISLLSTTTATAKTTTSHLLVHSYPFASLIQENLIRNSSSLLLSSARSMSSTNSTSISSSTTSSSSIYDTWSREQLIQRIHSLENSQLNQKIKKSRIAETSSSSSSSLSSNENTTALVGSTVDSARKLRKQQKLLNMPTHRIALKLAYLGWYHEGFAAQSHTENTIETHLFKALEKSHLCANIKEANYDRCGRTDIGVSAIGNVVSLNLRSRSPTQQSHEEYPYALILNRLLPFSIRILAWAYVPSTFSSRFSCHSRTYTYLLPALGLNFDKVQEALKLLEGEHDFRNFCKLDPNKPERNYLRTIFGTSISLYTSFGQPFFLIQLHGSAFLWHQIRFIMHILTLIGLESESPDMITSLFDVDRVIAKPVYPPASELPLILTDCAFEDIHWEFVQPPTKQNWESLQASQTKTWIRQFLFQKQCVPENLPFFQYNNDGVSLPKELCTSWMHSWAGISFNKYTPVLNRNVCDSVESKAIKLKARNDRKDKLLDECNNSSDHPTPEAC